jgi:signal transduction histidine kinase/CheY-like chemotaxis protein
MKALQAATAVSFLLLILAWVPLRTIDIDGVAFDRVLATLDRFSMVENALDRDALSARVGLLRNYDPLGHEEDALNELVVRLKETSAATPDQAVAIDRLAAMTGRQALLVEQFKSSNALLQNSLAYFQLFSSRLGASADPETVSAVMALDSAMLQLTLDTSPAADDAVADRLARLTALTTPAGQADSRVGLLAHGGMLHSLLPQTDGVLKALYGVPVKAELGRVRAIIMSHQAVSQLWAERLRLLLYATSVILAGFLIYLARNLRARARALRERAAFEHVTAGVSMRFLNAPPHAIDAQIERALAEFAALFDADRAYFLQVGKGVRSHVWRKDGAMPPGGWLAAIPALSDAVDATGTGIIHIPRPSRLPPGPVRDGLASAGLQGWLSMTSTNGCGVRRILCFDALRPGRITDPADLGFARMALDVLANAEEKQALEQEKARLAIRLQQARRMETVGALASGIAHNFNNLIGAILGYAEMAEGGVIAGSRIAQNLFEIRSAGDRARELVEQILDFGRPRHEQRATIEVDALIAEAASLLRASLPNQIELVVLGSPEPAVISGEVAQLQQVILNLCNNAAQAMAEGGRIEIATMMRDVSDPLALDRGELAAGRHVGIAVSDTGRGMSDEIVKRIFEPFYTTRQAGNGLGLATVKEIVIEHGGAIEVHSTPGVGSRFEVWLPSISASFRIHAPAPTRSRDRMETVLLLDDDRERLRRDEEILAAIGYEPVGFTRLADAVAACRNTPDRFDALVIGRIAAVTAVVDVAAALHRQVSERPILLATTSADEMDIPALTACGVREVVSRPLDPAEIAAALQRCLGASSVPAEIPG